ncbi:hypothetical protein PG989_005375 [Apiospora arundinis]|uniref:Krueppel-like factor 14 n=1 Tax=Apiospora arundinis TaxID=335852 RepID=A0ABR2ITS3_9PEZI
MDRKRTPLPLRRFANISAANAASGVPGTAAPVAPGPGSVAVVAASTVPAVPAAPAVLPAPAVPAAPTIPIVHSVPVVPAVPAVPAVPSVPAVPAAVPAAGPAPGPAPGPAAGPAPATVLVNRRCPKCNEEFSRSEHVQIHQWTTHVGTVCWFPNCGIITTTEAKMRDHLEQDHVRSQPANDGKTMCGWPECGNEFRQPYIAHLCFYKHQHLK